MQEKATSGSADAENLDDLLVSALFCVARSFLFVRGLGGGCFFVVWHFELLDGRFLNVFICAFQSEAVL